MIKSIVFVDKLLYCKSVINTLWLYSLTKLIESVLIPDSRNSSYSPLSSLMKSLSSKSPRSDHSSPTHRIYIAKHDYAPSHNSSMSSSDPKLPITHSLLPDLPLLAGDTVVAIGNPDERKDGKVNQKIVS